MKHAAALLFTAIIMVLVLWTGLTRSPPSTFPAADHGTSRSRIADSRFENAGAISAATASIEKLLASAREGDVAAYLSAFGGSWRARLEREADEHGRDEFARRLRRAAVARKSHAIFAPEPVGKRALSVTVESTFADRLERQTFRLERASDNWLVMEVEIAHERVPENPLGAPARFDEPEGIPVAAGRVEPLGDVREHDPEP